MKKINLLMLLAVVVFASCSGDDDTVDRSTITLESITRLEELPAGSEYEVWLVSGGENISSIEIENTLAKHPSVSIAAVVAKPDEKWGEVPCAFIEMVQDKPVTEKELIDFCKETLAGFKVPKKVIFCELPKTSTGKIQKFELRKQF